MLHANWTRIQAPLTLSDTYFEEREGSQTLRVKRMLKASVREWLLENLGEEVVFQQETGKLVMFIGTNGVDSLVLKFKQEEAALHFKIAWC